MTSPAAPEQSRVGAIDALRGIALCGILLVNIIAFGGSIDVDTPLRAPALAPADWTLWWLQRVWVEGAMRGLFTVLFGASFLLFMAKAERGVSEAQTRQLFLRRLIWLLVFGVVDNTLLLWPGDILLIYALAGLILLPVWRWPTRRLLALAAVLLITVSVGSVMRAQGRITAAAQGPSLEARIGAGQRLDPDQAEVLDKWREMRSGTLFDPADLAKERSARLGGYGSNLAFMTKTAMDWTFDWSTLWWIGDAAALFVLGMALFRTGVLQGRAPISVYLALVIVGYGLGLPLRIWQAGLGWREALGGWAPAPWQVWAPAALQQTSRTLMVLGHLGLFHLAWRAVPVLFVPFRAMGQMALTGYLGQSVLAALIFAGFGLGWWGRFGWLGLWSIAAAVLVAEMLFCLLWLRWFRMGPLEWVWRWLTYGRPPVMTLTVRPAKAGIQAS